MIEDTDLATLQHWTQVDHDNLISERRGLLHCRGIHENIVQVEGKIIVTHLHCNNLISCSKKILEKQRHDLETTTFSANQTTDSEKATPGVIKMKLNRLLLTFVKK